MKPLDTINFFFSKKALVFSKVYYSSAKAEVYILSQHELMYSILYFPLASFL